MNKNATLDSFSASDYEFREPFSSFSLDIDGCILGFNTTYKNHIHILTEAYKIFEAIWIPSHLLFMYSKWLKTTNFIVLANHTKSQFKKCRIIQSFFKSVIKYGQ